jgi:hypothetical protein
VWAKGSEGGGGGLLHRISVSDGEGGSYTGSLLSETGE